MYCLLQKQPLTVVRGLDALQSRKRSFENKKKSACFDILFDQGSIFLVAHQPNENKPTKVIGGYPGFKPDTLLRPLQPQKGKQ